MICKICLTPISDSEAAQYAAYGGLPSPCCKICFDVNNYSIRSIEELAGKSLKERALRMLTQKVEETAGIPVKRFVSTIEEVEQLKRQGISAFLWTEADK